MNQQAILQSNLLDIIFENRNKDYGAYKLRKTYQSRLGVAVFSAVGLALLLSLCLLPRNTPEVFTAPHLRITVPGMKISGFYKPAPQENKEIVVQHAAKKIVPEAERPPLIVALDNINRLPATPAEIESSFTASDPGMNLTPGGSETNGGGLDAIAPAVKAATPVRDKSNPVEFAEIMPQYPGGIKALLSFLKKNIHSPGNSEEGEDVTVKVTFVVNYNGNLENFIVIKSGGEIFDNEVLRVLKKMPPWTPGKSKGENISVYYTVPVKFTSEF